MGTRLHPVRFGLYEFDLETRELRRDGAKVRLEGQPIQFLTLLLERPGEIVTQDEIRRRLWPDGTVVEFEHSIKTALRKLRQALGDDADAPLYIETLPRRGYRFIAPMKEVHAASAKVFSSSNAAAYVLKRWKPAAAILVAALFVAGVIRFAYVRANRGPALTSKDSLVLSDFTNATGDRVFDLTLRQGLAVQLEQSPFLSLVSEAQIQQTLRLMGRPRDTRLTPDIAREVCERSEGTAVLDGSIVSLGNQFVIGLKAVNCRTGNTIAEEQASANGKEHVLTALDRVAIKLRKKLGESLDTVQKFDVSIEQASTPSLDALQAYSLGMKAFKRSSDFAGAVLFFRRAIALDPNFAAAYAGLGMSYSNLGETELAATNVTGAYELRERVTEREKLAIECAYDWLVTGNVQKARQRATLWAQTYPRDDDPHGEAIGFNISLGQYGKALEEARENLHLAPAIGIGYGGLVNVYLFLNRLDEARAAAETALSKGLDSAYLRFDLYELAFLRNDPAAMAQQVAWAADKPGAEDLLLATESDTASYYGHLDRARQLSRRAIAKALQSEEKETAASYEADAAIRESLLGNAVEGGDWATSALKHSTGRDVQYGGALAFSLSEHTAEATKLADDLNRRFPEDTLVQFHYLPVIQARLALSRDDPRAAIEALESAAPFELGCPGSIPFAPSLYPVYVRGQAYLALREGKEAAAEFQKILDHRGLVFNEVIGALAYLELARALAVMGETTQARAQYEKFLTLWKDGDAAIPVLKQARAQFANLH